MSAESLLEEARKLSPNERLRIAEELWDSVRDDAADDLPLRAELCEELDRRLADVEANPNAGSSWEEVRGRIERKL
jgi:putative addiction module component (TIGR02574 family)